MAELLEPLVADFHVGLVKPIDCKRLCPRAYVRLDLSGIAPDVRQSSGDLLLLQKEVTVDLFEPTQRELIRPEAVALAAAGFRQREIAAKLSVTQTAVGNALALDRQMREQGLTSPFVPVLDGNSGGPRLRRDQLERYRFEPMPGYPLAPR